MIYTVKQLAERLRVAPEMVRSWINYGHLDAFDVSSPTSTRPRWRITEEAFEAFKKRTRKTVPQRKKKRDADFVEYF